MICVNTDQTRDHLFQEENKTHRRKKKNAICDILTDSLQEGEIPLTYR